MSYSLDFVRCIIVNVKLAAIIQVFSVRMDTADIVYKYFQLEWIPQHCTIKFFPDFGRLNESLLPSISLCKYFGGSFLFAEIW